MMIKSMKEGCKWPWKESPGRLELDWGISLIFLSKWPSGCDMKDTFRF